jgi:long-chain acyl-CoA synthetase
MSHRATVLNLASLVEHQARMRPEQTAVVCDQQRLTYAELNAAANRVANGLRARGIKPGDHVALLCPNLPYFPLVYNAILKTGAAVVALNVLFKPREIAYHLRDSDARLLFCFEGTVELPMAAWAREALPEAPDCERLVVLPCRAAGPSPFEDVETLDDLMRDQPLTFDTEPTQLLDTAVLFYTSGTTGQPKGAELSHLNMVSNAQAGYQLVAPLVAHDDPMVTLITLPLFHSTGQTAQMNTTFAGGGVVVLLPRFEPAAVLETMRREKVNTWVGVPTMHWTLLQYVDANGVDVSPIAEYLRVATSGGAPMPIEVLHRFEKTFAVRVLEGYGLSETAPIACFNQVERPSRPGTVGHPLPGVEVRCVDDSDVPVPVGDRGEVVIRGPNIMKGYYKRPEATAEAMKNGWFHTGDIGILDADGYLSIVDRKKDMILRGGYNVYPREIEETLMTHPAVSLVAVIGIPDDRLGEEVKAFVVRKPGAEVSEEALIEWSRSQMAGYKYPRLVEFRDALPLGATGKILKRVLREPA